MKILFAGGLAFANLNFKFLPNFTLLTLLAVVIGIDFLTGVWKAKCKNEARTSDGFRKTVNKFLQYGCAIVCGAVLSYIGQNKGGAGAVAIAGLLNDGLIIFIIYIEVTSIFENLYAVDSTTAMSQYFYAPVLKILTFQIKNNPIMKQAAELEKKGEGVAGQITDATKQSNQ
jgi:phage-related holin